MTFSHARFTAPDSPAGYTAACWEHISKWQLRYKYSRRNYQPRYMIVPVRVSTPSIHRSVCLVPVVVLSTAASVDYIANKMSPARPIESNGAAVHPQPSASKGELYDARPDLRYSYDIITTTAK